MRVRIIVAIVVSAVLAFGWGALAWSTGLYEGWAFRSLPQGDGLPERIAAQAGEDGAYVFPPWRMEPDDNPQRAAVALEQARSQRERGPHIMVLVRHQPVPAAGDLTLVKGFALELFVCAILAGVMAIAAKWGMPVQDRLAIAFAFAAFAMCSTPAVQWNFWHLPDTFGLATAADAFVTWLVAGVTCALIIRPLKRRQKAA
jgi:hypothetical protein